MAERKTSSDQSGQEGDDPGDQDDQADHRKDRDQEGAAPTSPTCSKRSPVISTSTNSTLPNGGVITPTESVITIRMPKKTGSIPSACTVSMKIGVKIRTASTTLMKTADDEEEQRDEDQDHGQADIEIHQHHRQFLRNPQPHQQPAVRRWRWR